MTPGYVSSFLVLSKVANNDFFCRLLSNKWSLLIRSSKGQSGLWQGLPWGLHCDFFFQALLVQLCKQQTPGVFDLWLHVNGQTKYTIAPLRVKNLRTQWCVDSLTARSLSHKARRCSELSESSWPKTSTHCTRSSCAMRLSWLEVQAEGKVPLMSAQLGTNTAQQKARICPDKWTHSSYWQPSARW